MQMSSKFTIALHILLFVETFHESHKITSEILSNSTNVNAVIIRNILLKLKAANLIEVKRGTGGVKIIKPIEEITFFDVYNAVEYVEKNNFFSFHKNPNQNCPLGKNIHNVLDDELNNIEVAFENKLKSISLKGIAKKAENYVLKEGKKNNKKI